MNCFRVGGATVLADFAHNPHGFRALFQMAAAMAPKRMCVLLGQAGDRSDADVRGLCLATAEAAPDLVLIKDMPEHLRGREPGDMVALIDAELRKAGLSGDAIEHAPSELDAVDRALAWARDGDLVLLLLHAQRTAALKRLRAAAQPA
jgi:UDP-N-acetylmuramyl tripeptide synthase